MVMIIQKIGFISSIFQHYLRLIYQYQIMMMSWVIPTCIMLVELELEVHYSQGFAFDGILEKGEYVLRISPSI